LLDQIAAEQSALVETKSAIVRAQETRVPSDTRTAALRELSVLQAEVLKSTHYYNYYYFYYFTEGQFIGG